ncbi:1-Acyl-Sn-Glycerol-3-Phosphate acyltransferase [Arthrobacter sp. Hiyo8]|nr:1-Acyl-Sn-Glycerol-3-Phosphate acyltransferase [Arthrobacter sp. Hiyo8]
MEAFDVIRWTTRGLISSTCRPTVIGLENVPKEGPFIVAPNHLSFLDSVIVQALMPRRWASLPRPSISPPKASKAAR